MTYFTCLLLVDVASLVISLFEGWWRNFTGEVTRTLLKEGKFLVDDITLADLSDDDDIFEASFS